MRILFSALWREKRAKGLSLNSSCFFCFFCSFVNNKDNSDDSNEDLY